VIIDRFDTSRRVFVIAEAGINHEGDVGQAREMVAAAADAGADAIKFQTYKTERLLMARETARIEQRRKFELPAEAFRALAAHAHERGILFLSTAFDGDSLRLIDELAPAFKISSPDFNNLALIRQALAAGKPLIMSTGMSDDARVEATLTFVRDRAGPEFLRRSVTLLHCVSLYPAPFADVNLHAIPYLAERFGVDVGYSDHALGINMCLAAVALGARIVEKHFTLDKSMTGVRDHKLSADPGELGRLVEGIRQIEAALGTRSKRIAPAEAENLRSMRRGIVAAADLPAGAVLTEADLDVLLPCDGMSADRYFWALGKRVRRPVAAGEAIRVEDLQEA